MSAMGYDPALWLPEHWDNPFCRVLGPEPDFTQLYEQMLVQPLMSNEDRGRPAHLRRSCVLRLFNLMLPFERQVDLGERIHKIIRLGYQHRNPADGGYRRAYLSTAAALEALGKGNSVAQAQALIFSNPDTVSPGFVLLGSPGMGKTRSVNRILAPLLKPVVPDIEEDIVQLPAVKVECPSRGGRAQLCLAVASAIDRVLGTGYHDELENGRITGDYLMMRVQHYLNLHATGLLVLDEIQHLLQSSEGVRPVMNFLVTLVNLLGIPVMLVGTNESSPVIQGSFREARRAAGLGQPNWNRLMNDEEWKAWLASMWEYQYTATPTELTPELNAVIYDESQGILDIAVKLFALGQMRAITRGEAGSSEELSPALFRQVAAEEFQSIAPMIAGLRSGNPKVLSQYPDLTPLHEQVERVLSQALGKSPLQVRRILAIQEAMNARATKDRDDPVAAVRAYFVAEGFQEAAVDEAMAQAVEALGDGSWALLGMKVRELLAGIAAPLRHATDAPTGTGTGPGTDKSAQPKRRKSRGKAPAAEPQPGSLMAIVEGAGDPHKALVDAGAIGSPGDILAA